MPQKPLAERCAARIRLTMRRFVKGLIFILLCAVVGSVGYGAVGYRDALRHAEDYAKRADSLIAEGHGPAALGDTYLRQLILVQDPGYLEHRGVDVSTHGAGLTTISQSLAKRLGFDAFRPGVGKIRQTGFALGLEARLSKDQILALWLDTVEMGRGPNGWMTGFFAASEGIYGRPPIDISDGQYHRLLAVLIAPGRFRLLAEDEALEERSARIARLVAGACSPKGHRDVWLEGCAVNH